MNMLDVIPFNRADILLRSNKSTHGDHLDEPVALSSDTSLRYLMRCDSDSSILI
jgi:hypothetical protein